MNKTAFSFLQEIINDFNILIEQVPDNAFNYCSRGILKFSLNDTDGAYNDWSTASQMGCESSCFLLKELAIGKSRNTFPQT